MRIVNKRKFVRFLVLVLMVLSMTITLFINGVDAKKEIEWKTYRVQGGDTLWSISEELNEDNKKDIRKIIWEITKENNLENEFIKIGQLIKIPNK